MHTAKTIHIGCSLLLLLVTAQSGAADPVTDQIDAALRAYKDGEPRVAIQALQFAAAQIEEQLAEQRASLLPEPLKGWSAEPADSTSGGLIGLLTGTNISRSYRQDGSGARVSITVTADSPLLTMMNMLMASPMLMQAEPGTKPYSFGAYRGMMQTDGAGDTQLSLMLGTRILMQIDGSGGATKDMLEAYLKAMDLKALEKALIG
ncbi:hypothetical protein [Thiorhodovibrio frisius]|uniref:Uncharacterized protein n=1 Tax=Thiorhodovibrio frisius TaxID=631362 RepID=H8YY16_9GAMM|nr:hypothetical protein [Thiorhodovibrio frisius]EIC23342.1 hypothetical protein Thi970DRAFT_01002 [Thiorhodovibrio frisius]WPL23578.1 hypothetical protein Thiofri_03770 [Thiorhodovibrio frisius]